MTYEESIREIADRNDWEVYPDDRGGLTIIDHEGRECFHRLGGHAEALFDRRQGRGRLALPSDDLDRFQRPGRWRCFNETSDDGRDKGVLVWRPWDSPGISDPRVFANR